MLEKCGKTIIAKTLTAETWLAKSTSSSAPVVNVNVSLYQQCSSNWQLNFMLVVS